jgi:tRNA(Ile)-lysidine synthetase-like protein
MLNKLLAFIRKQELIASGDSVTVAVSGGADSVALLFALYLLKDKLRIHLSAAHFNHHLRGEESDRDEAFVREFCGRYDIPLTVGHGSIVPGKKGLEAAARDARYAFLRSLPGKIATAHTADDNAETVLMHIVRGTGLKGLGGIAPQNGGVIRPLLTVTRQDVEDFCAEWCLSYITDSSNEGDDFLRNRLRHHVMPLLRQENPAVAENTSAMALRLRQDEDCLAELSHCAEMDVDTLRKLHPALRSRALEGFLKRSGIREPEASHIAQAEALVFSRKPSAFARFPGGIAVARNYGTLMLRQEEVIPEEAVLPVPGSILWGDYRITASEAGEGLTLYPTGPITVRSRRSGDSIRLSGGSKSLKKLFIDRKIPAAERALVPVICDKQGILAVYGIGIDQSRDREGNAPVWIQIEKTEKEMEVT